MSNKLLPTLILLFLGFGFASPTYAQNTQEIENLLNECEEIIAQVAEQRDRSIKESDKIAQERDEVRGQLLFVLPEYEALKKENKALIRKEADKPSRLTWMLVGSGGTIIVGLLTYILLSSL